MNQINLRTYKIYESPWITFSTQLTFVSTKLHNISSYLLPSLTELKATMEAANHGGGYTGPEVTHDFAAMLFDMGTSEGNLA